MKKMMLVFFSVTTLLQLTAQQTANCRVLLQSRSIYIIDKEIKVILEMDTGTNGNTGGKITMRMSAATTNTITTGEKDHTGQLPVNMLSAAHNVSMMVNQQDLPSSKGVVPPDMHFYGKYQAGQLFRLDSIGGSMPLADSVKTKMATMVDAAMNNFAFPLRPLRVGDSFTCGRPLLLPGVPMPPGPGLKANITFTLMRINGNIAGFDFTESIAADPKQDSTAVGKPINMTGTGSGNLNFDMKNNFFSSMSGQLYVQYDLLNGHLRIKCRGRFDSRDQAFVTW